MESGKRVLVTGGAGFIGSALVRYLIRETDSRVANVDKLTYAGNLESLRQVAGNDRYHFWQQDICDRAAMEQCVAEFRPEVVIHLAAESHVDRSIDGPKVFIETNVGGTENLLSVVLEYWKQLAKPAQEAFRFIHVSTDEVYGSLGPTGFFTETTPYQPRSPYSATKAASDHLARAWFHTFGLPTIVTNCSNNYGPYQFPEKLIPLTILNILERKPIGIYGKGDQIRDWLYVDDHVKALWTVAQKGQSGETYNIGGRSEKTNLDVVKTICRTVDERMRASEEASDWAPAEELIRFVTDRPGHDQRYAIDCTKIEGELAWAPERTFEQGIAEAVSWYLENDWWWRPLRSGVYGGERLGK